MHKYQLSVRYYNTMGYFTHHNQQDPVDLVAAESPKHSYERDDYDEASGGNEEVGTCQEHLLVDHVNYTLFLNL